MKAKYGFYSFFLLFFIEIVGSTFYLIPPLGYHEGTIFAGFFYSLREAFRKLGHTLKVTHLEGDLPNFGGLIACNIPHTIDKLSQYPKEKLILYLLEPPTVEPRYYDTENHRSFGKVFIMLDNYLRDKKYAKLYYPQTSLRIIDGIPFFAQKKFCILVASNKNSKHPLELYSARRESIRFFERYAPKDFDLYGSLWDKKSYPSYKGPIGSKKDLIKQYKFSICYENMRNVEGYITEKIFDAFVAGCVPIYWGAQNVTKFIPANCFIDRRNFKTNESLYIFLRSITYEKYQDYIRNIKKFLQSPQAFCFSQEYAIHSILRAFLPNYAIAKVFSPQQRKKIEQSITIA